jgi:hypothetical protein
MLQSVKASHSSSDIAIWQLLNLMLTNEEKEDKTMTEWHQGHLSRNITNSIYNIFSEFCCWDREQYATANLDALGRILVEYLLIISETRGYLRSKNRTCVYWQWLKNVWIVFDCRIVEFMM